MIHLVTPHPSWYSEKGAAIARTALGIPELAKRNLCPRLSLPYIHKTTNIKLNQMMNAKDQICLKLSLNYLFMSSSNIWNTFLIYQCATKAFFQLQTV